MTDDTGAHKPEENQAAYKGRIFFLNLEPYSSNQGQTLALATGLVGEGWVPHIVCRDSCNLANRAEASGVTVHRFPAQGGKTLFMAWKLLRLVSKAGQKNRGPVLIHACDPTGSQLASLAWKFNKKLHLVHTRRVPIMEADSKAVRCYQVPQAAVITDSLAGKIALRLSGLAPERLHTISCGINTTEYPVRKKRSDGRFRFAMTAELMPHRGHAQLFDALKFLEAQTTPLPPWEVRILGEGPYLSELLEQAEERQVATHLAFLSGLDANRELARCDALVLPAPEGESFLPLILHGWAAEVPVITVNRLDHAEVLQDEKNCLLAEPGDTAGLTMQMARLAGDPGLQERLVEGGRMSLARFSLRTVIAEHERIYRDILK